MTDETLFVNALEQPDSVARAAYLDAACGTDSAQRKRLDALLAAHDKAGAFLERPAVAPAEPQHVHTRTFGPEEDTDRTHTHGGVTDHDTDDALGFLAPANRPDSLGRLGHYEMLEILGHGAFGIVFRAFDDVLQRVVAVKVLAPSLATTSPARKRFIREARSSAKIRHENVVQVFAVEEQPLPHLVMEYIPGETLQDRLDKTGPLDVAEIVRIGRQIAEGLAAAHANGLIHRDIKPSNILIEPGPEGRVKLTDFGLARAADDASLTRSGTVAGTPLYMAPEQAKGETLDHRADLFSLGSVMYVMCSGRPPFRAESTLAVLKRVAEDDPRPIREIIPETPDWLCRIIEKLHAKNPADRFQTAREVADVLADCEKQLATHKEVKDTSRIPAAKPKRRALSLLRFVAIGLPLLLFAVITAAVWAGPFVVLYPNNEGRIALVGPLDPDFEKLLVRRDGQVVATLDPSTTQVNLPPGDYELEAVCITGYEVTKFHIESTRLRTVFNSFERVEGRPAVRLTLHRGARTIVVMTVEKRAPAAPTPPDEKLLQGKWMATSMEMGGKFVPVGWGLADVTFTGDRIVLDINDDNKGEGTFTLNPTRNPREIDIVMKDGRGRKQGIYHLEGNRLTLCLGEVGAPRPTRYETGDMGTAVILERQSDSDGFVPLFNGKDLAGWKVMPTDRAGSWKVENGVLIGSGKPSHLFTTRGNFGDFHLRIEARIKKNGPKNGALGVFARVPFEDPGMVLSPHGTGSLYRIAVPKRYDASTLPPEPAPPSYREQPLVVASVDLKGENIAFSKFPADEWFTHEIIMDGKHVTTKTACGNQTSRSFIAAGAHSASGHIALQLFDDWSVVEIRKIEIKELEPTSPEGLAREERARLSGEWIVRQAHVDQEPLSPADLTDMKLSLQDGKFMLPIHTDSGYVWPLTGKYELDVAKKQLTFDIKGQDEVRCTYRVEGEKLVLDFPGTEKDGQIGRTGWFAPDVRAATQANLHKLGLALHNYADKQKDTTLPPAAITKDGKPLLSWRVAILPQLDQEALYLKFKLDEPWDSEHNKKLIEKMPPVFAIPGKSKPDDYTTHYRVFVGPGTAFEPRPDAKGFRFPDFDKGTTNTIMVAEAAEPVIWTKPDELAYDPKKPLPRLGVYSSGAHLTMGDGSVGRLSPQATEKEIRAAIERNGDEVIPPERLRRIPWRGPALHLEFQRAAPAGAVLLKALDPAKDKAVPVGTNITARVENNAWRIEDTLKPGDNDNILVTLGDTLTEGIPTDGVIIFRAKVKLQPKDKNAWGDLLLNATSPSSHNYDWPAHLSKYRGEIAEWTQKEVRFPAAAFHKKNPPTITMQVSLVGNGVLWLKDVELIHVPAAKPSAPKPVQKTPDGAPKPVLLKALDPTKDRPEPLRGDASKIIRVDNGAWRIENNNEGGNFRIALATITEGIPEDGVLIYRAKIKLQPKHKATWGDLELNATSPSFHDYDWPAHLGRYQGEITEWTQKEVRFPVEAIRKKNPPTITLHVGLHADGVLWVKDVELLHLPAAKQPTDPAKKPDPTVVQSLKDAVAAKTRARDVVKDRFEVGIDNKIQFMNAEAELAEARITLAEAEGDTAGVVARLEELVKFRQEERDALAIRVKLGSDAPNVLDNADARLADAKARLAKVKPRP